MQIVFATGHVVLEYFGIRRLVTTWGPNSYLPRLVFSSYDTSAIERSVLYWSKIFWWQCRVWFFITIYWLFAYLFTLWSNFSSFSQKGFHFLTLTSISNSFRAYTTDRYVTEFFFRCLVNSKRNFLSHVYGQLICNFWLCPDLNNGSVWALIAFESFMHGVYVSRVSRERRLKYFANLISCRFLV